MLLFRKEESAAHKGLLFNLFLNKSVKFFSKDAILKFT